MTQRGFNPKAIAWATNYVEGFNAADADRISILSLAKQQAAEDAISGDRLFRVVEGYARVPEFLLRKFLEAGGELLDSAPVRTIAWKPGWVEVTSVDDRVFQAAAAIVTLPLGVLQARSVRFTPQPAEIFDAVDRLAMGLAARVVYEFDSSFWPEGISFFFAPEATPTTWWTTCPRRESMLTGWIAGRKASKQTMVGLPETGLASLAGLFGVERTLCVDACFVRTTTTGRRIATASEPIPTSREGPSTRPMSYRIRYRQRFSSPASILTRPVTGARCTPHSAPAIARQSNCFTAHLPQTPWQMGKLRALRRSTKRQEQPD